MTGINIQNPWSEMLINGEKCVETRHYPLPEKYTGEPLALIETSGKQQKFKARIIGFITFSHSFKYENVTEWMNDYNRHKVSVDSLFGWNDKKDKYGWVVSSIHKLDSYQEPPKKKGIIFTLNCNVLVPSEI
tara:strand:- start:3621 stop:4016 length:396 start_codon:yes stop_codon:yes gene_type:complete